MRRQTGFSLISLVVVLALLAALVWFVAKVVTPPIIKQEIETRATQEWGAEVNVGKVSLSLVPLGATIYDIQLTDHNKPEENLMVIQSAFADPDVVATLKTDLKPILERVDIRGVEMHQPRTRPGKVYRKPKPIIPPDLKQQTQTVVAKGLPDFKMPDPQRILKEEKLETVETAHRLQQRIAEMKQQWQALQQKLPNEKTLEELKQQLAQLQKQGLNPQALNQLDQLQQRIKQEQKKLEEARTFFADLQTLQKQLQVLTRLPEKDLQRLRQRYTFNVQGATHLVETLLGAEIQPYITVVQRWMDTLQQLTARKPDTGSQPDKPSPAQDLLIRTLTIDGRLPSGRFDAEARDVTLNQAFYGVITPYQLRYYHAKADKPVVVKGKANLQDPKLADIQALLEGVGIRLQDLDLVKYPTLSLALKQAMAHISGKADVLSWEKIQGELSAQFKDVAWALLKVQDRDVQRYLTPVLNQIQDFNIRVGFSGSLHAPRIQIQTDLDKALSSSLQKLLRAELQKVEKQLAAELRQRAQQKLAELSPELAPLLSEKGRVEDLDKQLKALLEQELKKRLPTQQLEEEGKKKLEEKARDELLKHLPKGLQLPKF